MPRIRTVKPELASDRKLAQASRDARYTFVLLISQADDDGLVRAEPRQLLGSLYPHDYDVTPEILERWLAELDGLGLIHWRHTRDGMRVAELVNWSRHQNIKHRSKPFLLHQLAEANETLLKASGDIQEDCVSPSGNSGGAESLSLESRVLLAPNGANGNGKKHKASRSANGNWVPEAVAIREKHIGLIDHGKLAGILGPLVGRVGWPAVKPAWEYFNEFSPVQDFLKRVEAGLAREGEEPVRKVDWKTEPKFFVEHFTEIAREVAA